MGGEGLETGLGPRRLGGGGPAGPGRGGRAERPGPRGGPTLLPAEFSREPARRPAPQPPPDAREHHPLGAPPRVFLCFHVRRSRDSRAANPASAGRLALRLSRCLRETAPFLLPRRPARLLPLSPPGLPRLPPAGPPPRGDTMVPGDGRPRCRSVPARRRVARSRRRGSLGRGPRARAALPGGPGRPRRGPGLRRAPPPQLRAAAPRQPWPGSGGPPALPPPPSAGSAGVS